MPGLVDSFLNAYQSTVSLHNKQNKEKQDAIQQEVENAFKQHQLDQSDLQLSQNEAYRRDNLAATKENRKYQQEDRAADNARSDKIAASNLERDSARQESTDKKNAQTAKQASLKEFNKSYNTSGLPRQVEMDSAGVAPEDQQNILGSALQALAAHVSQQNAGAQQRADAGAYGPTQSGGNLVEFANQPTMQDAQQEISPAFRDVEKRRAAQNDLAAAREEYMHGLIAAKTTEAVHQNALRDKQAKLAEARALDLPARLQEEQLYHQGMLDISRFNSVTNRWRAQISAAPNGPDSIAVRQKANDMRDYLRRENGRVDDELSDAKEEERDAAQKFQETGVIIERLYQAQKDGIATPADLDMLRNARTVWAQGEQILPQKTKRVQELQAQKRQLADSQQKLLGIGETPVTNTGQAVPLPKFKAGALPGIGGMGGQFPANPLAPGMGFRESAAPVTRQFRNKKSGKMETFTLKNGAWSR